jgi:hypothetical protein
MTSEQIERLRKGLGSTPTSTVQEDMTKLLDEREALLEACKAVMASDAELNAPIAAEHMGDSWYSRRLELERRERAALNAVKNALAKALAP